ncbi:MULTISPECIES: ParA family protein [Xanthomonas]|uniref:ParA family protein n=1 Tax=Xanthomonas TaxID=338 RepID=UPI001C483340|nr:MULTISPECIES: ParA family protein [Xanthomonas]MBV6855913.1 ParA family protein [Xanthomonas campestris pv. mirabilis]MBV6867899.1 ParA family protein [Xanthomonas campestris pv. coriandri]MCE4330819.1 ParA family protein [Xanthomonas campestris pv. coriandri]MEA9776917.1 ParA family protein [Xanthomonas campestris pv. raphani]
MKVVSLANRKGGVGKSTLSVHLVWYLAELGYRVALVDLDTQANSSSTLRDHDIGTAASVLFKENPTIEVPELIGNIGLIPADPDLDRVLKEDMFVLGFFDDHLHKLSNHFDFCVIDTSPSWDRTTEAALLASDYFATPVDVETYAIEGLQKFIKNAQRMLTFKQRNGGDLKFLGIIANRVSNTSPMHLDNLKGLVQAYPQLMVPQKISARTNIGDAIMERTPVWKSKKTAAREAGKEMKDLFAILLDRMGVKAGAK